MNTKGTITFEYDEFSDAPWVDADGHGPVRKSNNAHNKWDSDKRPGERPLNRADRSQYQFYYDWQKAMKMAVKDWGFKTKSEALKAVQSDFKYLQDWINGKWNYVFVIVEYEGEKESVGAVETYNDYHIECGNEILANLIARVEKEKVEREYWNSRDVCTV